MTANTDRYQVQVEGYRNADQTRRAAAAGRYNTNYRVVDTQTGQTVQAGCTRQTARNWAYRYNHSTTTGQ